MNQRGVLLETPGAWSEPLHWPLRDGERKLLTVGSNADWSIADGALLPVHATLYFDGASLCVAAAPGTTLNGQPLGKDWSPIALPAQLSLGDTKITLASSDSERPLPEAATTVEETEADRLTPPGAFQSPFVDPDATMIAMPALTAAATQAPRTQPLPPPQPQPSPAARPSFGSSFRAASWPKRLTLLLLPVVIGLYGLKAVRSARDAKRARPAPSASSAHMASSAPSASSAWSDATVATVAPGAQALSSDARAPGLTLQRRAVDAFASGNFRDAAVLYRRLAAEYPKQTAFPVAARVASERTNGIGHD